MVLTALVVVAVVLTVLVGVVVALAVVAVVLAVLVGVAVALGGSRSSGWRRCSSRWFSQFWLASWLLS